ARRSAFRDSGSKGNLTKKSAMSGTRDSTCHAVAPAKAEALACHVRSTVKADAKSRCAENTRVKIDNFLCRTEVAQCLQGGDRVEQMSWIKIRSLRLIRLVKTLVCE